DGQLYAVDNNGGAPRVLSVHPDGTAGVLGPPSPQLGLVDGIEIDGGGHRLLVTSHTAAQGDRLLSVDLRPGASGPVTALAPVEIEDGYFPTGIVYDQLGTAIVRKGDKFTGLQSVTVPLP